MEKWRREEEHLDQSLRKFSSSPFRVLWGMDNFYGGSYGNPETGYGGNPYPAGYGMNPGQGSAEGVPQYGPGPGSWGTYDMQRAHGHR
ncbi:hypothetical protein CK203_040186 [Vitis vinifera]|uniref:Uncharacterized protein n=1 Tax=Vitis vinifera TaxID=29760 RepID=A0A438H305_VITVI|nr:hypothetical protein CK203_040186 [Vitis vinifera]